MALSLYRQNNAPGKPKPFSQLCNASSIRVLSFQNRGGGILPILNVLLLSPNVSALKTISFSEDILNRLF